MHQTERVAIRTIQVKKPPKGTLHGQSGLEAQHKAVADFLHGVGSKLVGEFTEIESGKRAARPELETALTACRLHRATLVVARVDRLTRSVSFLSKLLEAGVEVRFCDLPQIEGPTGRFILQQMAAVAELEGGLISARTRAALQAAKARGMRLGGFRGRPCTDDDRRRSIATRIQSASSRAADLAPTIRELQAAGASSLRSLASRLNERCITAPRGGPWSATQVRTVLDRITALDS